MDELIRLLIATIVMAITLPPFFTVLVYLIPIRLEEIQAGIEQRTRRSFVIGFINALFFGLVIAVFANQGDVGGLMAMIILLFILALSFMGVTAFVRLLRNRIFEDAEFGATLKTAVLLTGAMLTPILGWFIVTPLLALFGLGATIPAIFRRRKRKVDTVV
ncbi:MAG: hypothetical protein AAF490_32700 [Chloroflexota bacterium]